MNILDCIRSSEESAIFNRLVSTKKLKLPLIAYQLVSKFADQFFLKALNAFPSISLAPFTFLSSFQFLRFILFFLFIFFKKQQKSFD